MSFLKQNPKALLDAIPTPRGDEEKMLRDLKSGLTPKADMNFQFNETQGNSFRMKFTNPPNCGLGINSGVQTPSRSRYESSPKTNH